MCGSVRVEANGVRANAGPSDNSEPPIERETTELPPWRLELSRRLQELKNRREGNSPTSSDLSRLPFDDAQGLTQDAAVGGSVPVPPPRRAPRVPSPRKQNQTVPEPPIVSSRKPSSAGERLDAAGDAAVQPRPLAADVRQLIDAAIARGTSPFDPDTKVPADPIPLQLSVRPTPAREPDDTVSWSRLRLTEERMGNRVVLISRTLAGLIDLLIISFCTIGSLLAADVFVGIDVFDSVSLINAGLLLTCNYFLYSIFFLGTAGQTPGMMMTSLHVVAAGDRARPGIGRILVRCVVFPPALLGLGVGLLWGCFDSECRCLHDIASRTQVEPLDTA
jgi:uncharacterized RDD family membrane protein YckC